MTLILSAGGDDAGLGAELSRLGSGWDGRIERPGIVAIDALTGQNRPVALAWARQTLPDPERVLAPSINAWAGQVFDRVRDQLPANLPWSLHVAPHYGVRRIERMGARAWHSLRRQKGRPNRPDGLESESPVATAGVERCRLIRVALLHLLKDRRRSLARYLREEAVGWTPDDSLVQVLLTSPEAGWISVARAPLPWHWRQLISPFPKGELPVALDRAAPSRAFAKLVEAEQRLGRRIAPGEVCVDLGAAPGGWSFVALQRGARVTAVDRSPLREDLMQDPQLSFCRGDAFAFAPVVPVDWLLADVIAAPESSIELLLNWLRQRWMRWFVVTLKLKGTPDLAQLDRLKRALPELAEPWFLTHLCANKGEVCTFGRVRDFLEPQLCRG